MQFTDLKAQNLEQGSYKGVYTSEKQKKDEIFLLIEPTYKESANFILYLIKRIPHSTQVEMRILYAQYSQDQNGVRYILCPVENSILYANCNQEESITINGKSITFTGYFFSSSKNVMHFNKKSYANEIKLIKKSVGEFAPRIKKVYEPYSPVYLELYENNLSEENQLFLRSHVTIIDKKIESKTNAHLLEKLTHTHYLLGDSIHIIFLNVKWGEKKELVLIYDSSEVTTYSLVNLKN